MGLKMGTVKLEKYNPKWKDLFNEEKANLKETSLFELANMCGLPPKEYIDKFIVYDRNLRSGKEEA